MEYNPAFDGLRAIAVLGVLAFHAGTPFAGGGYLGVDLFFVLSGYLITRLLVAEQRQRGEIDLRRFWLRRLLRLYPTLLLMLVAFLLVAPSLWPDLPALRYALWSALYMSDYSRALLGEPIVLNHTWSLSVEEHFYLIWPLLIPLVLRTQSPVRTLAYAYGIATAWRFANYMWLGWDPTYFRFDTRLSGLILGCLLVFWQPVVHARHVLLAALLSAVLVLAPSFRTWAGLTFMLPIAEGCAAVLLVACVTGSVQLRCLAHPAIAYVGRLSYGLYIWHYPAVFWLRDHYSWPIALAGSAVLATVLAMATYHAIDIPLKRRWQRYLARRATSYP